MGLLREVEVSTFSLIYNGSKGEDEEEKGRPRMKNVQTRVRNRQKKVKNMQLLREDCAFFSDSKAHSINFMFLKLAIYSISNCRFPPSTLMIKPAGSNDSLPLYDVV